MVVCSYVRGRNKEIILYFHLFRYVKLVTKRKSDISASSRTERFNLYSAKIYTKRNIRQLEKLPFQVCRACFFNSA